MMAYTPSYRDAVATKTPRILIVPETSPSDAPAWQSHWQDARPNCHRLDLGLWQDPHRNTWINKLNLAIHRTDGPVVLVAHGLGCAVVSWWVEYEQISNNFPVIGALLVTPPDIERPGRDERLARFGACPRATLPFPSFLVASRNDPGCSHTTALALARDWGSNFAGMAEIGHADKESGLGPWSEGLSLLDRLTGQANAPQTQDRGMISTPNWPLRTRSSRHRQPKW